MGGFPSFLEINFRFRPGAFRPANLGELGRTGMIVLGYDPKLRALLGPSQGWTSEKAVGSRASGPKCLQTSASRTQGGPKASRPDPYSGVPDELS